MQLIVKLQEEQARKARKLVEAGLYASYNEFIMVAIQNQINLEEVDTDAAADDSSNNVPSSIRGLPGPAQTNGPEVPLHDGVPPTPGPIWGQYNRFAPTIVALRTAAKVADDAGTPWIPIKEYWKHASDAALAVGQKLRDLDTKRSNKRGSRLDTAFPLGKAREKSLRRFQQQFAGDLATRTDRPIGMAPECGFLQVERRNGKVLVSITEIGRSLAALPFPAIDEQNPETTLGADQIGFLLEHISRYLPNEARFIQQMLARVDQGNATPQDLDVLAREFDTSWNEDVARTQRGGLIGRLNEMALVTIGRTGLQSTYDLTEAGKNAIRSLKGGIANA